MDFVYFLKGIFWVQYKLGSIDSICGIKNPSILPAFFLCSSSFPKLQKKKVTRICSCTCLRTSTEPPEDENYIARTFVECGQLKYTLGLINLLLHTLDTVGSVINCVCSSIVSHYR